MQRKARISEDVRKRFLSDKLNCKVVMGPVGCLNGYVAIPKGHALFGKGYSESICNHPGCYKHSVESLISVHGGLTYSGSDKDGLWWFGFDTGHASDDPTFGGTVKDESYVEKECRNLAKQLANWKTLDEIADEDREWETLHRAIERKPDSTK